MTRIAFLVSSAQQLTLEDGSTHQVGCFAQEVLGPHKHFGSAGFEIKVITPDGRPPTADTYGSSWFFHCPEDDVAYLASVVRTFANHVEDIRLTLHQYADLGLTAARRVDALLRADHQTAPDAHRAVCAAARVAWRKDLPFAQVLADDGSIGLTLEQAQGAVDAQRAASQRLADQRHADLQAIPGFRHPVALSSLTAEDTDQLDAVFVPGGYGPMTDLSDNPNAGQLLLALHRRGAPIGALDHGPAVLLSAPERADGLWLFDGYRMTSTTDEEEDQTEAARLGMAWRLDVALTNAGAVFDDGSSAWVSHIVVDRNLITGQNPASTAAIAGAMVRRLGVLSSPSRRTGGLSPEAEESPPTVRTPSATVQAFLDATSIRDIDTAVALAAPGVSVTVHPLKVAGTGAETLRQILFDLVLSFPDLRIAVDRVITTGDVVTALFSAGGTQSADYAGAITMNKHLDIDQAWRFTVADGMITEVTAYWCQAQLYRRLAVKRYDEIAIA